MEISKKKTKVVEQALDAWLEKHLQSKSGVNSIKKAILDALTEKQEKPASLESTIVARVVKLAAIEDQTWLDMSASKLISRLVKEVPELSGKLSAVAMGRALKKAGAISKVSNGISVYRINKLRTKKIK